MNPSLSQDDIIAIYKTLSANDGVTDVALLNQGGALSKQFLDTTMASLVAEPQHFRFLKQMPKRKVTQTLLEFTRRESLGENFFDNSFVSQSADPSFGDVVLKRLVEQMTYISRAFSFSRVSQQIQGIADPELEQTNMALKRIMIDLTRFMFHGDKSVNAYECDGFVKKITALNKPENVIDCRGQLPSAQLLKEKVAYLAQTFYAVPNQFWMPIPTKNLFDNYYFQTGQTTVFQNATQNPKNVMLSNIVPGFLASEALNGMVNFETERFMDTSGVGVPKIPNPADPTQLIEGQYASAPQPPTIAVAAVAPSVPGSLWAAGDAGTYAYRVAALNGQASIASNPPASDAVLANGAITITITPAIGGNNADSFAIFRETAPGNGDFKLMKRIPRTVGPTTVYTDINEDLPGTGIGVMGDFNATSTTDESRTYILSELLPPLKTLFPEGVNGLRTRTGMVEHYVVPQIFTPERFILLKNLPVK